jgi:hypothetical protein
VEIEKTENNEEKEIAIMLKIPLKLRDELRELAKKEDRNLPKYLKRLLTKIVNDSQDKSSKK